MTVRLSRRDTLLFTGAVAASSAIPRLPPAVAAPLHTNDIDAILKARIDAGDAPGVVAMAATKDAVIYQGAFGVRAKGAPAAMSSDTVFAIASMTKLLTSVAALQLVERGKLSLDEPAARIDPTLENQQVLEGFDAKGNPQLRPARKPITLRHLLTHTSGFSYQLWDANVLRYGKIARSNPALPRTPLMFDPDTRWAYGGSLDRVGRLVEIASGQTLDRYFRDNITGPLGMHDTAYAITDAQRARQASLHLRKGDGTLVAQPLVKQAEPKAIFRRRRFKSTAPDFLTLLQAILNGGGVPGKRILRPQTVEAMSTNQIGDIDAGILKTTNPPLSGDVDFFPGVRLRWGLAGMINIDPVAGRPRGRQPDLGRSLQYLLLDRSGLAHRGRDHDADPAVRRPPRAWGLSGSSSAGFIAALSRPESRSPPSRHGRA